MNATYSLDDNNLSNNNKLKVVWNLVSCSSMRSGTPGGENDNNKYLVSGKILDQKKDQPSRMFLKSYNFVLFSIHNCFMKMALPVNCELSCRHWLGLLQSTVGVRMHNVSLLQPFSKSKPFPVFIKPINKGWQRKIYFSLEHILYWMMNKILFITYLFLTLL